MDAPGLSATQMEQLATFARLVRESPHNLVSKRARDEIETRHIPECVALAQLLPVGPQRLLDVGSGGGFPGMVIAIVRTDLEVHLLDSTAKKTSFLRSAATMVEAHVAVHTDRAEVMGQRAEYRGSFDVVTARAVAPLDRLIGWVVPFLRPQGLLYAMKGERWADELAEARGVLARTGASVVATPDDVVAGIRPSDDRSPRVVVIARTR